VGAILSVAMLITPGATAYLLTDRLERMLGLSIVIGALSAIGGYYLAAALDASIAGAMTTVAGLLFALAFFFSPLHGAVMENRSRAALDEDLAPASNYPQPRPTTHEPGPRKCRRGRRAIDPPLDRARWSPSPGRVRWRVSPGALPLVLFPWP